ncbi:MAG: hypothetical protein AABY87_06845 [bacterium]
MTLLLDHFIDLPAVVHSSNNLFKIAVIGRYADPFFVLRFGVPWMFAAFVGAAV